MSWQPSKSPVGIIEIPDYDCPSKSWQPSKSPVGIMSILNEPLKILSWQPSKSPVGIIGAVLTAVYAWSWQPSKSPVGIILRSPWNLLSPVLAAFQIPSWYNGRKKKAPVTWCFLLFPLFKITEKRYQSGSINDPACFFEKGCPLAKRGHYLAGTSEEAPCLGSGPSNSPVGIMKLPSNLHCSIYGVLMK